MIEQNKWSGQLTRQDSIKIIASATNHDDPYWENLVDKHYDETSDTMPSIFHVFAALGITVDEYKEATGAQNVDWPEQNKQPPAEAGEAVAWMWRRDYAGGGFSTELCNTREQAEALLERFTEGGTVDSIHPLYTSQTTATQAAVAAAVWQCAEICREVGPKHASLMLVSEGFAQAIESSIPAEATAALRELLKDTIRAARQYDYASNNWIHTGSLEDIVDRILAEKGLK